MERYLPSIGLEAKRAEALGDRVRSSGRVTLQPQGAPAVRLLEAGADMALLAREEGGPAWPAVSTRWRTDFVLERMAFMPGGHLAGLGQWEPVTGLPLRTSIHVNTVSDLGRPFPLPRSYAAYLALLALKVAPRAEAEPLLSTKAGPSGDPLDQCLVTVRARVTDTYTVPNDLTGESVRMLWLSAPGSWALLAAVAAPAVPASLQRGDWAEVTGLLQGDLVASSR